MNEREELKKLIIENPDVCDRLLEILQSLKAQTPHNPSTSEESE